MNAATVNPNQFSSWQTDDYQDWYNRGEALAQSEQYAAALNCFNRALVAQPDSHAAWLYHGVVLVQLGRYQEAITSCDRALAIAPEDRQAWLVRGAALNYLGRYQQSYANYNCALGIGQLPWQKLLQWAKSLLGINSAYPATATVPVTISNQI